MDAIFKYEYLPAAAISLVALVIWIRTKSYEDLKSKSVFTVLLLVGLSFALKTVSGLYKYLVIAQQLFQLVIIFTLMAFSIIMYRKQFKTNSYNQAQEPKAVQKSESELKKLEQKLKVREIKVGIKESGLKEELIKIKELEKMLAKKENVLENEKYELQKRKEKESALVNLRAEVVREMEELERREDILTERLSEYRDKLQDVEDEKESVKIEREKLQVLKSGLKKQKIELKEKKKRYLDAYERLDMDRDILEREQKMFEKTKSGNLINAEERKV